MTPQEQKLVTREALAEAFHATHPHSALTGCRQKAAAIFDVLPALPASLLRHPALRSVVHAAGDPPEPTIRPCHVTGMHVPDHHLTSDKVCDIQARDTLTRLVGDLTRLRRELHPDCGWCTGSYSEKVTEHAAWAEATPEEPEPRVTDPGAV